MYTGNDKVSGISLDVEFLDNIVTFARKNWERALTSVKQLDILLLRCFLHFEHMEKQKKRGTGTTIKVPQVSKTISKMP